MAKNEEYYVPNIVPSFVVNRPTLQLRNGKILSPMETNDTAKYLVYQHNDKLYVPRNNKLKEVKFIKDSFPVNYKDVEGEGTELEFMIYNKGGRKSRRRRTKKSRRGKSKRRGRKTRGRR